MISLRSFFGKKQPQKPEPHYIDVGETGSTNSYLKSILATLDGMQPLPPLVVAYADYQREGHGQGSNTWESEEGKNLLFSILCRPEWVPVQSQFLISEAIAVALQGALSEYTDGITIKWPNDIYWHDSKISGTLIESTLSSGHIKDCIVGTGVNVNQTEFRSDAPNPVSLAQILGHEVDRMTLLRDIVERFGRLLDEMRSGQYGGIAGIYMSNLYRSHGFYPYRDKDGDFEAAIVEVEDDGHLILRDREGMIRSYAFKEVCFLP